MPQPLRSPRVRDADATRARLLRAATDEFAAHGIAGARIDRIEAAADANRALIYTYFRNKDGLFDAVMDASVARVLDEVPFTPGDLPGYAGRLFDFLGANPSLLRLATWHRLERADTGHEPAGLSNSYGVNTAAVAHAQTGHRLAAAFAPEDLYVFTLALASAWMAASPHAPATRSGDHLDAHRSAVVEAVRRLTGARPTPTAAGRALRSGSPVTEPATARKGKKERTS
jgi:AcrR family transcriptional regulator